MSEKLDDEKYENYREAGKIISKIMEEAREMVEPEASVLEIAETVEQRIEEEGAKPAFPCNISINEKAAHFTPASEDDTTIEEGDLVKIDMGAHVKGYIADMATTVLAHEEEEEAEEDEENKENEKEEQEEQDSEEEQASEPEEEEKSEEEKELEKRRDMIETINEILEEAIEIIEPGVNIGEIGKLIEEKAKERGYESIENLTGHNLDQYSLHGGISIPNVEKDTDVELEEGQVIALEPFITDGEGEVEDMQEVYIFKTEPGGSVSGRMAQQTLRKMKGKYKGLPFAERWLTEDLSRIRLQMTLRELVASEAIRPYYVLKEVDDGVVAQAEHTVIVTEDGCEITTKKE